jgi:ribosome-binding protein aMBF1 (putative translation factor)
MKIKSKAIELVKEALEKKGWNQKELAERAELSGPTISRCLTGDLLISRDVAEKLAAVLDLDRKKLVELALLDRIQSIQEEYGDYPEVQKRLELSLR